MTYSKCKSNMCLFVFATCHDKPILSFQRSENNRVGSLCLTASSVPSHIHFYLIITTPKSKPILLFPSQDKKSGVSQTDVIQDLTTILILNSFKDEFRQPGPSP